MENSNFIPKERRAEVVMLPLKVACFVVSAEMRWRKCFARKQMWSDLHTGQLRHFYCDSSCGNVHFFNENLYPPLADFPDLKHMRADPSFCQRRRSLLLHLLSRRFSLHERETLRRRRSCIWTQFYFNFKIKGLAIYMHLHLTAYKTDRCCSAWPESPPLFIHKPETYFS